MTATALKLDDDDISTNRIVEAYADALKEDVGQTRFAEKRIADICGCGLRTARNWLDKLNAPDDRYKIRLIRSGHFPTVAAVYLSLAGIQPQVDPRLAHALTAAFAAFQQVSNPDLPQGNHLTDPSMKNRTDESEGWGG